MVVIRRAVAADANAIARVQSRSWESAYPGLIPKELIARVVASEAARAAGYRVWLADPSSQRLAWVADDGAAIVGMAIAGPSHDDDAGPATAELEAIYLDPDVIGTGIGRDLLQRVVDDLAHVEFADSTLWVLAGNARARRFYEAAGWALDGATKREQRPSGTLHEVRYRRTLEA